MPEPPDAIVPIDPAGPVRTRAGETSSISYLFEERGVVVGSRLMMPVVVDRARNKVIGFGGWTSGSVRSDTIEWDGLGWQRRATTGLPAARFGASFTFDEKRKRAILFGGFGALATGLATTDNIVWEWSGGDWAPLATVDTPSPRGLPATAVDPVTQDVWMFGGASSTEALDDLYRFDGVAWHKIEKAAGQPWPPIRAAATMAVDPATGTLLLFGGVQSVRVDVRGYPSIEDILGDTWSWNGTSWTQLAPQTSPTVGTLPTQQGAAPLSAGSTLLRDEKRNVLVLVHEAIDGVQLWEWDGTIPTWKSLGAPARDRSPNYRLFSTPFWEPRAQGIRIVGGVGTLLPAGIDLFGLIDLLQDGDESEILNRGMATTSWLYDGAAWSETAGAGDPGPRRFAASGFHAGLQRGVVFGGRFGSDAVLGDTWTWNGGQWLESTNGTAPSARQAASMAYDAGRGALVLFGGAAAAGVLQGDTWLWNDGWTQLSLGASPSARRDHQLVAAEGGVLAFGGQDAGGRRRDTWFLASGATSWQLVAPTSDVDTSHSLCAAYSSAGTYLYGGERFTLGGPSAQLNRFVAPGTWATFEPAADQDEPQARALCALFADDAHGQLLLAGGTSAPSKSSWYRFPLDAKTWIPITPRAYDPVSEVPGRMVGAAYFIDGNTGASTFYGGFANDLQVVSSRTWRIRQTGGICTDDSGCDAGLHCVDGVCCEASACGPCESCAMPGQTGICNARGVVESTPGCASDAGLACNAEGRCRTGDGSACVQDTQCASGTCLAGICCSAAGCTQRCIDDTTQQNPNGSQTSCGAYRCRGSSCASTCENVNDCAAGFVCTAQRTCTAAASGEGSEPGGCQTGAGFDGVWALGSIAALIARRRYSTTT